jgi:hypothetical protein
MVRRASSSRGFAMKSSIGPPPADAGLPRRLCVVRAGLRRHRMDERFEERFEGWGCEDTECLRRIPWRRLPGPLFHVWHSKASKERFERNRRLLRGASRSGRGSI